MCISKCLSFPCPLSSGEKVFKFSSYKSALLAESQLNNIRLLDTILKVKLCNSSKGKDYMIELEARYFTFYHLALQISS